MKLNPGHNFGNKSVTSLGMIDVGVCGLPCGARDSHIDHARLAQVLLSVSPEPHGGQEDGSVHKSQPNDNDKNLPGLVLPQSTDNKHQDIGGNVSCIACTR